MSGDESNEQREDRAQKLAYTQGRRDADVDAHLRSHEGRLNAINGSIERHAKNAAALRESIDALGEQLRELHASIDLRNAVDGERVKQLKDANEKQISNRTFWLGVCAIIAAFSATILAAALAQTHFFA